MDGDATPNRTLAGLVADMAELVARAFFGGIAAAVAMGAAILLLSTGAQASALAASRPALGAVVAARAGANPTWSAAPTPDAGRTSAGAGALWANALRTDGEASLQALGVLGLLSAAAVAAVAMVACASRRSIDSDHACITEAKGLSPNARTASLPESERAVIS